MAEQSERDARVQRELLERIEQNTRGKHVLMIKTLMGHFGFNASQRVRQSSLSEVIQKLTEWGIGHDFVGETSSLDYIRLFKLAPEAVARRAALTSAPPATARDQLLALPMSPFEFVFEIGDALEQARSDALVHDIFACIWSSRPLMLVIDAPDEFFALAGGMVSAAMRRRQTMLRSFATGSTEPCGPQLLSHDRLKSLFEHAEGAHASSEFPQLGAVYLFRDNAEDTRDEELAAFVRELYVPQTFRVKSRFASTAGDPSTGPRGVDDAQFSSVLEWIAIFAGAPHLATTISTDRLFDLSSLFAEACQLRECLMDRSTLDHTDPRLRAGFESTEHVALKNMVLRDLKVRFPDAELHVERSVIVNESRADLDEDNTDSPIEDRLVHGRPDVRAPGRVSVEVETLRALALPGSNPFFALEQKLRRKLPVYREERELWLIVPGDLALLAHAQLQALARNLSTSSDSPPQILTGLVDLTTGRVRLIQPTSLPKAEVRLVGVSWREQRASQPEQLGWDDVAGYSDIKSRLNLDLLTPLRDPARYAQHNLGTSNGLLLYGLPGCGKSLIGRVLAGVAQLPCRRLVPSDLTGVYIGEGTAKTRDQFDWALKQAGCLLIIDELDAIAPQRAEQNMHTDEKRQVNELLVQLDRIQGKPIVVVATTNYFRGIDTAVRRSGRFDIRLPIFPPDRRDRGEIFRHYLFDKLTGFQGVGQIDVDRLAQAAVLFAPADIRVVVETTARRAVARTTDDVPPRIDEATLLAAIGRHTRSIQLADALNWIAEAEGDLGANDSQLQWLREEVERAYPN